MRTTTIAAATLALLAGTAHAQVIDWDDASNGLWGDPLNWSPANVPNSAVETASIAIAGTYTVTLDITVLDLGSLSLTNPDATLLTNVGRSLGVNAGVVNNGLIVVNSTGGGATTAVEFEDPGSTLTGTGTLRLNGFSTRALLRTGPGADVAHGIGHTIEGFGRIEADMQNDGTVNANVSGQSISVLNQPIFNTGTMMASNGGFLDVGTVTILQNATGMLLADAGGVLLGGTTVISGTVDSANAGLMRVDGPTTFDAVTAAGDMEVDLGDTLTIANGLTNNADLTVNPTAGGATTTLHYSDSSSLSGTGSVILNGFSTRAFITTAVGETMTHEAPHTIRGYGRIDAMLTNNSLISADVSGQEMLVNASTITNTATMRGTNGGILDVNGTTITNTGAGEIVADAGTVFFNNATINGGTIDTINAGASIIQSSSQFNGVQVDGDLQIEIGDILTVTGGLNNDAEILVNPTAGGATTTLQYNDSSTLSGTGTVRLNGFSTRAQITTDAGQTVTHNAPHEIHGYGRIGAEMVNNSTISADVDGQAIQVINTTIDNTATMRATNNGILNISGSTVNNTGTLIADGGEVQFTNATINGGTIDTINAGASVVRTSSAFDAVTLDGDVFVDIGDSLAITNGLTNNAVLTVNPTAGAAVTLLRFDDSTTLSGTGTVLLNGFTTRAQLTGLDETVTVTQGPDHTLGGAGLISVPLVNNGTIAPGFSVGEMDANEDITNTDTANYSVEVSADNIADLIDSSAAYHADGTITIEYIDGFDPADYWNASVVQADGGVTGQYDTIVAPTPADTRLIVRVRYLPTEIRIGAVCKPDLNFDGMLNFFDISTFVTLYNAQDPITDIAAPFGAWNFFDIAAFITQYNAGCP